MPSVPPRRVSRRHVVGLAAGILLAALAVLPAVAADGDPAETVTVCDSTGGGTYEPAQELENDFYGDTAQEQGEHAGDIVPPFVVEEPRPGDPGSFPGRNWDLAGETLYANDCAPPLLQGNDKQVRICHATSSVTNPYEENHPAIENNGDLTGGHLGHVGKGPYPGSYPETGKKDWGDIIPPFDYIDEDGKPAVSEGVNWTPEGQAIWENGCNPVTPVPDDEPITPILECVEDLGDGKFLAHFGYTNPNDWTVTPPADKNVFTPLSANGKQPESFGSGRFTDVFQVEFSGEITWSLTGKSLPVKEDSEPCQGGSITVFKRLVPESDTGKFALRINNEIQGGASAVGDGGTTGTIVVDTGQHTVSETRAPGTSLDDYSTATICRSGTTEIGQGTSSASFVVRRGAKVECTITNTAKELAQQVTPVLECVVFNDGAPDLAVWGYDNESGSPAVVPLGGTSGRLANSFTPDPPTRNGQPTVFEVGRQPGVFSTEFEAGSGNHVWHLTGKNAIANAGSPRCTATLEVRKVVVPASDPGEFNLLINGDVVATGKDGLTSGPKTIGVGEGTVRETGGPNTSLADYDSSVVCTRNGTVAVSVPGTKVDGAITGGDTVVCTFTNVRKGTTPPTPTPPTPTPPPITPTPPTPPTPLPPVPPPEPPPPGERLDLVVTKTANPTSVAVGGRITWTMTVTNRSSVAAADVNGVKVDDPRSLRTRLLSLRASQGTCRPFTCTLGRLAPGASAIVVAVTEATEPGVVVDIVRVGSEEVESNYRNNVASAIVRVAGQLRPPTRPNACHTLTVSPPVLQAGRTSVVRVTASTSTGRPARSIAVRVTGAGANARASTDRQGVARLTVNPTRTGLVVFATSERETAGVGNRCSTRLGVLGASSTQVTG